MVDPLPSRGPSSRHQPPVSYHANAPHTNRGPRPSSYNPITIAPPTPFTLPTLLQTSSSTAVPLLPPPFRSAHRQSPHFQSGSDQASLPSLGQRIPSHFIQAPPLQSMSNSHSSAGSFTSPPFAPPDTAQVYEPDTWSQLTSSAGLNPSFQSDECHRDVSIDIDMNGSHSSFDDRGNTREGEVWNPDGQVRPLSPRNDVSQSGDARYEPPGVGGQVGGGVRFENYRLDRHQQQFCGPPPLDATEAIAKAMAAQRGDFVGGYKVLPPVPTFNLPNVGLHSQQEETSMTAGSRDNLPAPLSCAAAPVHATTARADLPQLSLRSPHSPDADSPVYTLVPPRLPLEGRAAKEAEMKRTMRICLPRKEVCDHLVDHYVSPLVLLPLDVVNSYDGCSSNMSSGVSPCSIDQRSKESTNRSGSLMKIFGQKSSHPSLRRRAPRAPVRDTGLPSSPLPLVFHSIPTPIHDVPIPWAVAPGTLRPKTRSTLLGSRYFSQSSASAWNEWGGLTLIKSES